VKISVVIPCLNAAATIGLQLDALGKQHFADSWEIIVADNGSTDDTLKVVTSYRSRLPNLRIVDASKKRGAAYAMNAGAAVARAEAVAFCDADDEVEVGWLQAMSNALSSHEVVASRFDFQKLNPPWIAKSMSKHPQMSRLQTLWYLPHFKHVGACGLGVKKFLHEAIGGFDESFVLLMDTDYCLRVQQKGVALYFAADALVHIRCRDTAIGSFKQLLKWGEYNVLIFKRYRQKCDYEWWRWKGHLKEWIRTARRLPQLMSSHYRHAWVSRLGWQVGILKGSLKYRVPPIPLP
jgi:glycosyltransferase involved in cell wall biosynthesis